MGMGAADQKTRRCVAEMGENRFRATLGAEDCFSVL